VTESNALEYRPSTVTGESEQVEPNGALPVEMDDFRSLYRAHAGFVWRSLRRLGVHEDSIDDLTQEVFLIAFRDRSRFEQRSSFPTWLYGIAFNLSRHFARQAARFPSEPVTEALCETTAASPQDALARSEAVRTLYAVLDTLGPTRRAIFVMAELEQMTAVEIAELTGMKLNTVYTRLRAARREFEAALERIKREARSHR
jgi:RNA polymerase sigma-70 factor (ECF subfamily)